MSSYTIIDENQNSNTYNFVEDSTNIINISDKITGYTPTYNYNITSSWNIHGIPPSQTDIEIIKTDSLTETGSLNNIKFNYENFINQTINKINNQRQSYLIQGYGNVGFNNIEYTFIFTFVEITKNSYQIILINDGNGTISSTITNVLYEDSFDLSSLTTTPNVGYEFNEYTYSPSITIINDSFIMPDENVTITATFNKLNYQLIFNNDGNGTINSTITTVFFNNTFHLSQIIQSPNTGYEFTEYIFNPSITITNDSFIMPSNNLTITANFNKITYEIQIIINGNGTVNSNKFYQLFEDTFNLSSITPFPDQYNRFIGYTSDNVNFDNNSFIMPSNNVTIFVNFEQYLYKLTYELNEGIINENNIQYIEYDSTVTLPNITPPNKFKFIYWNLNIDQNTFTMQQNDTFIMPQNDITITAFFEQFQYNLSYNTDGGIITSGTKSGNYEANTTITLPEIDKFGFSFTGWKNPIFDTDNSIKSANDTFVMPSYDITIYAIFQLKLKDGVNSIAITKENIIYTTDTYSSVINKIDTTTSSLVKIAGSHDFKGTDDAFTGKNATFMQPRNIILTNDENQLYLLDANNIRNIKLVSDGIRGDSIDIFNNVNIDNSIFQNGGFGISKTNIDSEICVISKNSRCIIDTQSMAIDKKILLNDDILDTYELVDIEYYNLDTYYILKNSFYFKSLIIHYTNNKNNNISNNYNLSSDSTINFSNDQLILNNQNIQINNFNLSKLIKNIDFTISLFLKFTDIFNDINEPITKKTGVSGWRLVRYLKDGSTSWHPENDNLAGTAVYGTPNNITNNWSVKFGEFDEIVCGTYDLTHWVYFNKNQLTGDTGTASAYKTIIKSSKQNTSYQAEWYDRAADTEDPWISVENHMDVPNYMVYGEDNLSGYHDSLLSGYGGMAVWVRQSKYAIIDLSDTLKIYYNLDSNKFIIGNLEYFVSFNNFFDNTYRLYTFTFEQININEYNVNLYVDTNKIYNNNNQITISSSNYNIIIGNDYNNEYPIKANIKDFRIYEKILNQIEIKQIYNSGNIEIIEDEKSKYLIFKHISHQYNTDNLLINYKFKNNLINILNNDYDLIPETNNYSFQIYQNKNFINLNNDLFRINKFNSLINNFTISFYYKYNNNLNSNIILTNRNYNDIGFDITFYNNNLEINIKNGIIQPYYIYKLTYSTDSELHLYIINFEKINHGVYNIKTYKDNVLQSNLINQDYYKDNDIISSIHSNLHIYFEPTNNYFNIGNLSGYLNDFRIYDNIIENIDIDYKFVNDYTNYIVNFEDNQNTDILLVGAGAPGVSVTENYFTKFDNLIAYYTLESNLLDETSNYNLLTSNLINESSKDINLLPNTLVNNLSNLNITNGISFIFNYNSNLDKLYNFKSHTFTNCDKIGYEGPTLQECRNYYNSIENIDWINNNEFYSNINGYQLWTVPESANYIINAYGTGTSNIFSNSKGAFISSEFYLKKNEKILLLIGQQGSNFEDIQGGSGGTFVVKGNNYNISTNDDILLIAGGGTEIDLPFFNSINLYSDIIHSEVQAKKTNNQTFIGGAGGFKFNGETGSINNSEGKSFINGGLGGIPYGGFGGGATTIDNITGGAGGFIGGNSGNYTNNTIFHTFGGYSYNNGILLDFIPAGNNNINGYVYIEKQAIIIFKTIKYNIDKLYDFNSYTFTTCGKIGNIGPTFTECLNYYSNFHYLDNSLNYNYDWIYNSNYFNMAQSNNSGYQLWTVPETATYSIEAFGAAGGWIEIINSTNNFEFKGSPGFVVKDDFYLQKGEKIMILVGQSGGFAYDSDYTNINGGGGGGGTFVVKGDTYNNISTIDNILLIAGGGGGSGTFIVNNNNYYTGDDINYDTMYYYNNTNFQNLSKALKDQISNYSAGGAGGFKENGELGEYLNLNTHGQSFINGGIGGYQYIPVTNNYKPVVNYTLLNYISTNSPTYHYKFDNTSDIGFDSSFSGDENIQYTLDGEITDNPTKLILNGTQTTTGIVQYGIYLNGNDNYLENIKYDAKNISTGSKNSVNPIIIVEDSSFSISFFAKLDDDNSNLNKSYPIFTQIFSPANLNGSDESFGSIRCFEILRKKNVNNSQPYFEVSFKTSNNPVFNTNIRNLNDHIKGRIPNYYNFTEWHQYVITLNNLTKEVIIYIDNFKIPTDYFSVENITPQSPVDTNYSIPMDDNISFYIGRNINVGYSREETFFMGILDDFRIYKDTVLNLYDIQNIYKNVIKKFVIEEQVNSTYNYIEYKYGTNIINQFYPIDNTNLLTKINDIIDIKSIDNQIVLTSNSNADIWNGYYDENNIFQNYNNINIDSDIFNNGNFSISFWINLRDSYYTNNWTYFLKSHLIQIDYRNRLFRIKYKNDSNNYSTIYLNFSYYYDTELEYNLFIFNFEQTSYDSSKWTYKINFYINNTDIYNNTIDIYNFDLDIETNKYLYIENDILGYLVNFSINNKLLNIDEININLDEYNNSFSKYYISFPNEIEIENDIVLIGYNSSNYYSNLKLTGDYTIEIYKDNLKIYNDSNVYCNINHNDTDIFNEPIINNDIRLFGSNIDNNLIAHFEFKTSELILNTAPISTTIGNATINGNIQKYSDFPNIIIDNNNKGYFNIAELITNNFSITNKLAISLYFYIISELWNKNVIFILKIDTNKYVFIKTTDYNLNFFIEFIEDNTSVYNKSFFNFTKNVYYHMVIIYDLNKFKFYINNSLIIEVDNPFSSSNTTAKLTIGTRQRWINPVTYRCKYLFITDIRIYNREITNNEIFYLYNKISTNDFIYTHNIYDANNEIVEKCLILKNDGNNQTNYNIDFPEDTNCDILLVAGGGGGGRSHSVDIGNQPIFNTPGAGGGGGGLKFIKDITLNGNYNFKVGKGGDGDNIEHNYIRGQNGHNTQILQNEEILHESFGGGGGGSSTIVIEFTNYPGPMPGVNKNVDLTGSDGGSGGGSVLYRKIKLYYRNSSPPYNTYSSKNGGNSLDNQGNNGGRANYTSSYKNSGDLPPFASGGGGAGHEGYSNTEENNQFPEGNGGDGNYETSDGLNFKLHFNLPEDRIIGQYVNGKNYFAGGGSVGKILNRTFYGGKGGGGSGYNEDIDYFSYDFNTFYHNINGYPNSGGGGAGGINYENDDKTVQINTKGGDGGSGIIIIKYSLLKNKLYTFNSHTFTNCNKTGHEGPSYNECINFYANIQWIQNINNFDVLKLSSSSTDKDTGYQLWTVPETSIYTIKVYGAYSGVHPYDSDIHGGKGAIIECDFELQMNDKFIIVIGQQGEYYDNIDHPWKNGSGGGASFFVKSNSNINSLSDLPSNITINDVYIVAGGGGGSGTQKTTQYIHINGPDSDKIIIQEISDINEGISGEIIDNNSKSTAGAGIYDNSDDKLPYSGSKSFINGSKGSYNTSSSIGGFGGFGGGGAANFNNSSIDGFGGGGGGFNGGDSGSEYDINNKYNGIGGESYYNPIAINPSYKIDKNDGHGKIIITKKNKLFQNDITGINKYYLINTLVLKYKAPEKNVNYGGFGGGASSASQTGGGGGGLIGGNTGTVIPISGIINYDNGTTYYSGLSGYSYGYLPFYLNSNINEINENNLINNNNFITRNYPNGEGKVIITKLTNTTNDEVIIKYKLNKFSIKIDNIEQEYSNSSNFIWSINSDGDWNVYLDNIKDSCNITKTINIDNYDYGFILNNNTINNFLIYDKYLLQDQVSTIYEELTNNTFHLPRLGKNGINGQLKIINKNLLGKYNINIGNSGKAHINNNSTSGLDTNIQNNIFNEVSNGGIKTTIIDYNNPIIPNDYTELLNNDLLGSNIFFSSNIVNSLNSNIGKGGNGGISYLNSNLDIIKGTNGNSGLLIIKIDKNSNLPLLSIDEKSDDFIITNIYKSDFESINFNNEVKIHYEYNIQELYGITFNKNTNNIILTCKINNIHSIISGYNSNNEYIIDTVMESKYKIKTLMDYSIIYDDDNYEYFIGKSSDTDKVYYISYNNLIIDDQNPNVISFSEQHEIYDYGFGYEVLVETRNIIYSNKYKESGDNNRLLYFNSIDNKLLFLDFNSSLYKTTTLRLNKEFDYLKKITINSDDSIIYLTEESNIYSMSLNATTLDNNSNVQYHIQELYESSNIIRNILYKNNKLFFIDDKLHSVDNEYLDSNLFNNHILKYDNIISGIDNEDFENLTDFTIDTNNEVGYLAFDTKIKWFYIK